jgi:general secretion pathway protein D
MRVTNRLGRVLSVALAVLLTAGGFPMQAKTRKSERSWALGRQAEQRKDYDKALDYYEQALGEDPGDAAYQIGVRRVRFQAGQAHIDLGQKLRKEGKLDEALAEFEKSYALDPSSSIAEQELRRTLEMIDRENKKGTTAKPEERGLTPAETAKKEERERVASILPVPELKPLSTQPINLRMANQPAKVLFETVGKLAGINVVFDPDYRNDPNANRPQSVELTNATLDEALDNLAAMTKSYWKPLSANTIFVTNDNQAKRREYEDNVVKVFYLTNLTTPQELSEITTTLRTVTNIQRIFQYNSQNALIIRGTPDQVVLAEKLINDLDKPKSEVVVDVLVMEANRTKSRDLAATLASSGAAGISTGIQFTPRNPVLQGGTTNSNTSTTTGGTTTTNTTGTGLTTGLTTGTTTPTQSLISLARIAKISTNDFSITLPGALLQAVTTDRSTKVLQSPQVRAANGQKASLRIGDKVPIASGGIQPFGGTGGIGGGYGGGLYSQFQFIDVGVNVDITPTVHGTKEVTLKVELEISTVRDRIDLGGISQPVIGQRKVTHEIRIKEGEVSLLGGLMQSQETKALAGIPGLMNIPILRRLFSSESIQHDESELLIALIPHIVRTPDVTDVNLRGIATGTDTVVKLNYAPKKVDGPAAGLAPQQAPVAIPGTVPVPATVQPPSPVTGAFGAAPQTPGPAPAAQTPPVAPPQTGGPPTAQAPGVPPAPAAASGLRLVPSPAVINTQAGGTFVVQLDVQNAQNLFASPFHMKFDPQVLRVLDARAGSFMSGDGKQTIFTRNIQNDTGDLTVNLNRVPGAGGISGSGTLVTLTFQAVKPGVTAPSFPDLLLRDSQSQPVQAGAPQFTVNVK